jgi:DNA/RNA endonuclease YhcR with UshA esterase domain
MLTEMILFTVLHTTAVEKRWVADTIPYEPAEATNKLYTETAARTVKGIITDTYNVRLKDGVEFMQMDIETDQGTIPVHLGPTWYMNEYADRFDVNKGRSVSVLGSVATVKGKEVLVASELNNEDGRQHMRLRHPSGIPAWVGGEHVQ